MAAPQELQMPPAVALAWAAAWREAMAAPPELQLAAAAALVRVAADALALAS